MKRRHFLTKSLESAGFICGLGYGLNPPGNAVAQQLGAQSIGGESRYEALAKALDRGAIQRGWLPTVNPGYH